MNRTSTITIGENRDKPRIWLQNRFLEKIGFTKGTPIKVAFGKKQIVITTDVNGENHVSGTGKRAPIIDLNTAKIAESLPGVRYIRAVFSDGRITISLTKLDQIIYRPKDYSTGEVYSGGGLLSEAAKQAGWQSKWAIERNPDYADIWQLNHVGDMHNSDVADVFINELGEVDLLLAGIPCEPFSKLRQNKKDPKKSSDNPEDHDNITAALFVLSIIEKARPKYIVFEEVPQFMKSNVYKMLMMMLEKMHYKVQVKTLCGDTFGEPTRRERVVVLASVYEVDFPEIKHEKRSIDNLLLPYDDERCEWWNRETKSWVFINWEKEAAKGNNFQSQKIEYGKDMTVQALTKRYLSGQAGNPIVKHPYLPDTYRWLTLIELQRIAGLPDDYNLGTAKTTAGEVIGQGVLVKVFKKIFEGLY
jgi:DNA (cytosine-5)-methyltransferase 1